jgi:hypothetical protein
MACRRSDLLRRKLIKHILSGLTAARAVPPSQLSRFTYRARPRVLNSVLSHSFTPAASFQVHCTLHTFIAIENAIMRTAVLSLFVALLLSAFASAAPLGARAARSFAQLSISTGTGGNALAEAKAKFPGSAASLLSATVSQFNVRAAPDRS